MKYIYTLVILFYLINCVPTEESNLDKKPCPFKPVENSDIEKIIETGFKNTLWGNIKTDIKKLNLDISVSDSLEFYNDFNKYHEKRTFDYDEIKKLTGAFNILSNGICNKWIYCQELKNEKELNAVRKELNAIINSYNSLIQQAIQKQIGDNGTENEEDTSNNKIEPLNNVYELTGEITKAGLLTFSFNSSSFDKKKINTGVIVSPTYPNNLTHNYSVYNNRIMCPKNGNTENEMYECNINLFDDINWDFMKVFDGINFKVSADVYVYEVGANKHLIGKIK